ncbi:TetR family transcriptional regulator [Nocardioides anomalus]|uniref:TetR family transcriptional regulator n=1 Tax=Nocardioides anomalus TaxID=2712223 RepID=A0A6G6WH76_9ACTN|nr:TetR family transcriptional regulator [Nocardioides anomalus]QIG44582.1 TetR family transcriptional regulator [Nocardioides anomalus]
MSTSPGLRERKKARTRATIQREALRLFARDGYAATSVEAIAEAAEVSPSTFFRYFPTKEEVVLADFIDEATIERFVAAPADLSVPAALGHAVRTGIAELPAEDFELEQLRNRLIHDVPELRRGMAAEMLRPAELLAEAIGRRLGRAVDEDVRMYAGAAIGALVLAAPYDAEAQGEDPHARIADVVERAQRLDRILALPD